MNCPQNKFHIHTMSDSQILKPEKVKIYHKVKFIGRSNLSCSTVFSFRQHFLKLKQQILSCFC